MYIYIYIYGYSGHMDIWINLESSKMYADLLFVFMDLFVGKASFLTCVNQTATTNMTVGAVGYFRFGKS